MTAPCMGIVKSDGERKWKFFNKTKKLQGIWQLKIKPKHKHFIQFAVKESVCISV